MVRPHPITAGTLPPAVVLKSCWNVLLFLKPSAEPVAHKAFACHSKTSLCESRQCLPSSVKKYDARIATLFSHSSRTLYFVRRSDSQKRHPQLAMAVIIIRRNIGLGRLS